jgi:hypothetical protein
MASKSAVVKQELSEGEAQPVEAAIDSLLGQAKRAGEAIRGGAPKSIDMPNIDSRLRADLRTALTDREV